MSVIFIELKHVQDKNHTQCEEDEKTQPKIESKEEVVCV
jgi:hypothetical protein